MRLHYKGKYNKDPKSLPHGEHQEGAVRFKEVNSTTQMAIIANVACIFIILILGIIAGLRNVTYVKQSPNQLWMGSVLSLLVLFPHELLHAICFKEDVYLYTNWSEGMLFVVGPETMSKGRFIFMSLLPNLVFGLLPYVMGFVCPKLVILTALGTLSLGMGAGDYYNVINAIMQMPKGARTYLYEFNSYWYLPNE